MRLIDANKIDFDKVFIGNSDFAKEMRKAAQELISNEPTAYDVDKKVKALKGLFVKWFGENWGMVPYLVRTIEIVKTEENSSGLEEFLGKTFEETHSVGGCGSSDDCARGKRKTRENLFRGKHIHVLPENEYLDGRWVYGYLSDERHINSPELEGEFNVAPETVCQYTGLTDKNGRKYEGDIFQASDGEYIQRYVIAWDENSLEWSAQCIGNPDGTLPLSEFRVSEIEVIGNIFDNPELIASRKRGKGTNGTGKLQSIFCLNVDCENYFEDNCMKIFEDNTVHISESGKCEDFKEGEYIGYKVQS